MRYAIAFHGPDTPRAQVLLDDSAQTDSNDYRFYDDAQDLMADSMVKAYDLVRLYNRYAPRQKPDNGIEKADIAEAVIELLSDTLEIHKRGRTRPSEHIEDAPEPVKVQRTRKAKEVLNGEKPAKAARKRRTSVNTVDVSTNETSEDETVAEPWDEDQPPGQSNFKVEPEIEEEAEDIVETPKKRGRPFGSKNKPKPQRGISRVYKYLEDKPKPRKAVPYVPTDPLFTAGRMEGKELKTQEERAQWQRERAEARAKLWREELKDQERQKGGRRSTFTGKYLFPAPKCMGMINPRRRGSAGYESMAIIIRHPGLSFEDFLDKGGRVVDLRLDVNDGNVVLKNEPPRKEED